MDQKPKTNYSWWSRRPKVEKILLVLIAASVVVMVYLASNLWMARRSASSEVCMSQTCIRSAARILKKMDPKADPCDDFYKFACGNFIETAIIPDDKIVISSFSHTRDKVGLQVMKLLEAPVDDSDLNFVKLAKTMYSSCMNVTKIEKEGLRVVRKMFKDLGGWPVYEQGSWVEKSFDWKSMLYRLQRWGWRRTFFFSMYVGTDDKNSTKRIFTISQPCMAAVRLKKGLSDPAVAAEYKFLVDIAVLYGADEAAAAEEMREVMEFQIELAKIVIPYEERKNRSLDYNLVTIRELQKKIPSIPWLQYINSYLQPIDMLRSDDVINMAVPGFFQKFEVLMLGTKSKILANYMFSRLLMGATHFLPEAFRSKEAEYLKAVYGKNEQSPRWKLCVGAVGRLHIAVSSLYLRNFVDRTIRYKVGELNRDIKDSFIETLKEIAWMDRKTKKHAILKAEKMTAFIGYPDELLEDSKVEAYYDGWELDPNDHYIRLCFNLSHFAHIKHIQELRKPVIKPDWRSLSYIYYVNAFYIQSENSIELPAGILQDSFFDANGPQYMNYGGIGEVIGHEITHGFDDSGRQYDKDGNMVDWWEPETNRTFARKSQCLVDQYSNYTVPDIEMNVNGVKTLGENIADNGGIKIAYRGYLKWLARNKEEKQLPGLPYTSRQMFWIATATNACTKYKKESLKQFVTLGVHAPSYFRVMMPFMNSESFSKDFNCPLGSTMNPKHKCQIW